MSKRLPLSFLSGALVFAGSVAPLFAGTIATPHVAGDFQGWDPSANPMAQTGSDIWTLTVFGLDAGSRHEFKITDGTWDLNLPGPNGPNSWLYADASGSVTITYDGNTYSDGWSTSVDRIGLSTDPGAWTAVGNWQSQIGGSDWATDNAATAMAPVGGGIYEFTALLAPGTYNWKAVVTASPTWDSISWDNRSVGTADWSFTTDVANPVAIFRVDSFNGVAQVSVVPEPTTTLLLGFGGLALLTVARRRPR